MLHKYAKFLDLKNIYITDHMRGFEKLLIDGIKINVKIF